MLTCKIRATENIMDPANSRLRLYEILTQIAVILINHSGSAALS